MTIRQNKISRKFYQKFVIIGVFKRLIWIPSKQIMKMIGNYVGRSYTDLVLGILKRQLYII